MKRINVVGMVFERLTVLEKLPKKDKWNHWYYLCQCSCGTKTEVLKCNLLKGHSKSCGCLDKERRLERNTKHGKAYTTEYGVWCEMHTRCYNSKCSKINYDAYILRGIIICDRWHRNNPDGFSNFYADMGPRPEGNYSIDRIDNDGNYEPNNCKWATKAEQSRNKRTNIWLTYNGRTLCQNDWAKELGIDSTHIIYHLKRGKNFTEIYEYFSKSIVMK